MINKKILIIFSLVLVFTACKKTTPKCNQSTAVNYDPSAENDTENFDACVFVPNIFFWTSINLTTTPPYDQITVLINNSTDPFLIKSFHNKLPYYSGGKSCNNPLDCDLKGSLPGNNQGSTHWAMFDGHRLGEGSHSYHAYNNDSSLSWIGNFDLIKDGQSIVIKLD